MFSPSHAQNPAEGSFVHERETYRGGGRGLHVNYILVLVCCWSVCTKQISQLPHIVDLALYYYQSQSLRTVFPSDESKSKVTSSILKCANDIAWTFRSKHELFCSADPLLSFCTVCYYRHSQVWNAESICWGRWEIVLKRKQPVLFYQKP